MLFFGLSIVNLMFLLATLFMIFGVVLMKFIPEVASKLIFYGKNAETGSSIYNTTSKMEVPKAWFKHFYLFAATYSTILSVIVYLTYFHDLKVPRISIWILDFLYGLDRAVKVSSTTTTIAMALITLQCTRRFYEAYFIQVFSSSGRMGLLHYLFAIFHYFAVITTGISAAEGFVDYEVPMRPKISDIQLIDLIFVCIFLYAWYNQYQSNLILAALRMDKNGKVVTEKHRLPRGGYFELVSVPHMFFEILMYFSLCGVLRHNATMFYCLFWVLVNQITYGIKTHKWYKDTFKDYPMQRKAIFPYVL